MTDLFKIILEMSGTGAIIIGIVILLKFFMRKLPRRFSCILWLIPAIRLICPVTVESIVSIFNAFEYNPTAFLEPLDSAAVSFEGGETINVPVITEFEAYETISNTIEPSTSSVVLKEITKCGSIDEVGRKILPWIWLAGLAIMIVYVIISYFLIWRKVRNGAHLQDNIYVCGNIPSPFVFGIIKPKIYVPADTDGRDLQHILAHERAHIGRFDHITKLAATAILAIHWFNPLVWLGFRLMTVDMELACDEKALGNYDIEHRKEYANVLLNMSARQNKLSLGGVLSFGESGIKTRIKSVLRMKKPKLIACIAAVAVIAAASVCMLTKAKSENYPDIKNISYMVGEKYYESEILNKLNKYQKRYIANSQSFLIRSTESIEYSFPLAEWKRLPRSVKKLMETQNMPITIDKSADNYYMELSDSYSLLYLGDDLLLMRIRSESGEILELFSLVRYDEIGSKIDSVNNLFRILDNGFEMMKNGNQYEIRNPDTDMYIVLTDENDMLLHVQCDRDGETRALDLDHPSSFIYQRSFPKLTDITGDGVRDLIITTSYSGTGVVQGGFSAVDGASFTELEIDYDAVNEILKAESEYIIQYDDFSQSNPYISGDIYFDNPENGLSIFGGIACSSDDLNSLTGNVIFCMTDSDKEQAYSNIYQIILDFEYDGEKLTPKLRERYYVFNLSDRNDFYTEYFHSFWNTMLGTGKSKIPLELYFSNNNGYQNLVDSTDLGKGGSVVSPNVSEIKVQITDIKEVSYTKSDRAGVIVSYGLTYEFIDGRLEEMGINYRSYIEFGDTGKIYCDIPMWGASGNEAAIVNYVRNPWEFGWLAEKDFLNGEYIESTELIDFRYLSTETTADSFIYEYEVEYNVNYQKEFEHLLTEPSGKKKKFFTITCTDGSFRITSVGY